MSERKAQIVKTKKKQYLKSHGTSKNLREVPQPDLNKNDDAGDEIIRPSGGIKESHGMRSPTKTSKYRLRKRRRVITYVESVCSDDTKNSMDSDFET